MSESSNSAGYQLISAKSDEEQQLSATEENSTEQKDKSCVKSPVWKATINCLSYIEGPSLLALPYMVSKVGLVAIAALIIVPFITYYTGAIFIECLYENNQSGERVRIRSDFKEMGEACWPRFGGAIVTTIQIIHLFLVGALYIVLSATISNSIFPSLLLSDKVSMLIAAAILLPLIFVKNLSQVAWLSLLGFVGLFVNVIIVLAYRVAHHATLHFRNILVCDIKEIPVSVAIIIFSYLCHAILPGIEANMKNRAHYRPMLAFSFTTIAIFKTVFSVCAFLSFSSHTKEFIVNSLPMGITRMVVNGLVVINVCFSYPFILVSTINVIEDSLDSGLLPFKVPGLVLFIGIRVLTNFLTLLPAIAIPHFALFMSFVGSFSGCFTALILPAIFHLVLKKKELKLYHYVFDVSIMIFGIPVCILGLVFTGKNLLKAFSNHS